MVATPEARRVDISGYTTLPILTCHAMHRDRSDACIDTGSRFGEDDVENADNEELPTALYRYLKRKYKHNHL